MAIDPCATVNKAALFNLLGYTPHPGQQAVHESSARFRILACGSRWGKSTCASHEILAALLAPRPKAIGWIVAPTVELTRYVMERVRIALLNRMPHRVALDDQRSQRLVVNNLGGGQSELRAKSSDSPAGLLGEALDFLVVDEAAKIRDDVWQSYLLPRLIDRKGWALVISTPRGAGGWFHEAWRRGQRGRDAEFQSWLSSTLANPHIGREIVEAERSRMTPELFEQEFEARFLGELQEQCEACGNPSDSVSRSIVFADLESEPRCELCGGIVDTRGRTREHRHEGQGCLLRVDLGPGLRTRLGPAEDFAIEVAKVRAELDRRRPNWDAE